MPLEYLDRAGTRQGPIDDTASVGEDKRVAELRPYPIDALVRRMFHELEARDAIFDLPSRKFFLGDAAHDLSVRFHGTRAPTPLGPAAGPQSQMAQNLVLAYLAGCRILELKTVQINDRLTIPRPCIDAQTIGFNVEWSQELKLQESLEEYVKGAMLIAMLGQSGRLALADDFAPLIFDMSVGYDLAGIQSESVDAFIRGMKDSSAVIDRLRAQIPTEYGELRDVELDPALSRTLTLSTFHGCPSDEIEKIVMYLLEQHGLNVIVKLNPTLLGPLETRRLVGEVMGYEEIEIPDAAFEKDTKWDLAVGFVERLGARADELGLSFGVKFTNTLVVKNHRDFFPESEKEMYLSGPPLHVLAINLVGRFRAEFGDRYPISFSAGIDSKNFPDAVALGLAPVTVCTDLLKPGGYGRARSYFGELMRRMDEVGATTVDQWVLKAFGYTGEDVSEARVFNAEQYVPRATADPRYSKAKNDKPPKKIGRKLVLFDCLTCDKCIPVCPNDANFDFVIPAGALPMVRLVPGPDGFSAEPAGVLTVKEDHQIGNFADFCNECGNCDVFCPEDGGPYAIKPRFFGRREDFDEMKAHDGFYFESKHSVSARISGKPFQLVWEEPERRALFAGEDFSIRLDPTSPDTTAEGTAAASIDLTYLHIIEHIRKAIVALGPVNPVSALLQ